MPSLDRTTVCCLRATQMRNRVAAAVRLPPLPGRHGRTLAAYDPDLTWPPAPRSPSTYGLSPDERRHEAERLLASGWAGHEVARVLVSPEVES